MCIMYSMVTEIKYNRLQIIIILETWLKCQRNRNAKECSNKVFWQLFFLHYCNNIKEYQSICFSVYKIPGLYATIYFVMENKYICTN